MFQNVADAGSSKEKGYALGNVIYRLKEIFKYQNVIIYILTFLMSILSVKGQFAPFGLAMMAACIGESVPLIGVFIAAIIGTFLGNGLAGLGSFIITFIVYFIIVLVFKTKIAVEDRNELIKTGGQLWFSSFIVSMVQNCIGSFALYGVFTAFIVSAMTYVFYKIFVNGLTFIKDLNIKKAFTIEELVAGVIIISLASVALKGINIFSLNLSNIIMMLMIMILGWQNGVLVGCISGISVGLAVSLVNSTSLFQILMFTISGILSGTFKSFGKIGVIVGVILGNAILTYWLKTSDTIIIYFREIFVASIGLLLIPKEIKIELEDLVGRNKLLDNSGDRRLEDKNSEITEKLKTLSDMFNEISTSADKDDTNEKENMIQDFLDNLEELKSNIFYEAISEEENGIAKDICTVLIKNDIIVDKDLVEILNNHNNIVVMRDENIKNDLQEIIKIANRTLKMIQINKAKQQERKNSMQAVSESLKAATKVIDSVTEEIKEVPQNKFDKKEQELYLLMKSKNLNVEECAIKLLKNKKYIVEVKLDYNDVKLREKNVITNIADLISKCLGTRVVIQREKNDEETESYYQIYSSEDKFVLQVGSSKVTKEGSTISGDCSLQIKLADGKYLLALADGMGTGEKARECSKITLRLIKQMLSAGFDKEESISMINSRINLLGTADRYSTLDATILDLYDGKLEALKNGACNTYIKNRKSIEKIESKNLPIGIVNKIELQSKTLNINDGDIIVMCTDGVLDSKEDNPNWIEDFLKNVSTNNVQKLADLLLSEAIDNNFGVVRDDMSIIVSKIVKRK